MNILTQLINWANGSSGGLVATTQDVVPLAGQTITSNGASILALNHAATLSSLTITFPSSPSRIKNSGKKC